MSSFSAEVAWERGDARFTDNRYSRAHRWSFDGGHVVPASSSPHVVPLPYSVAENVDPEEAFVAALSSCHMLFFLSLAAKKGLIVDSYTDKAEGVMETIGGKTQVTHVTLNPRVAYAGQAPNRDTEADLHHRSHELCFLANSVKTEIEVNF
ncbi:OsmC family protein [Pedomonas mirosovicensis]|uniref:OsmC family protein n=1 Tax=Pedomonas mirosovicensis TaxID=2908641 RepID=UPI00216894F8|nr:OsmC family protein [Pedomonas mirosovicensis]MCH8686128.1 OsmC family protein [Pedomonas mirosovicensis]